MVKSWVLKDYLDTAGERLELVNKGAVETVGYPFSLDYIDTAPAFDANSALFAVTMSEDGLGIEFKASNGVTSYKKSFRFGRDDYLGEFSSEARHDGRSLPHLLVWRGGFGDRTVPNASTLQHSLYHDVVENDLVINDPDEAEDLTGHRDRFRRYQHIPCIEMVSTVSVAMS